MAIQANVRTAEEQIVLFQLAGEGYGVDIARIQGIIQVPEVTTVPQTAEFVEGVINLRGVIVPVVDLRKRFFLPTQEHGPDTRIINVEMADHIVGLVVDAVEQVLNIPADAIHPAPDLVTTIDSAYLRGIAKIDERLIMLLDLGKVLSIGEQADLQEMPVVS